MKKKEEVDEGMNEQVRKQLVSGEPVCRSEVQNEVSTERSSCKCKASPTDAPVLCVNPRARHSHHVTLILNYFHLSGDIITLTFNCSLISSCLCLLLQTSVDVFTGVEPSVNKPRPNSEEHKEPDVSGLINSDGEEEDWRPARGSESSSLTN